MYRMVKRVAKGLALLVVAWVVALAVWARLASAPPLGIVNGSLVSCPPTPNCVATQDARQLMPALPMHGDAAATVDRLVRIVEAQPRAVLVERRADYVRAEFRSRLFGYRDDVEFHILAAAGEVRFRSASRIGRGDMGVNRARMESLGAAYLRP